MAIEYNYDGPPSLEIYQDFVRSSTASANTQSVVIVAEHFDVVKKDYNPKGIKSVDFDINSTNTIKWEDINTTNDAIDKDSINLILEDGVIAENEAITGTVDSTYPHKIKLATAVDSKDLTHPIAVGDTIAIDPDPSNNGSYSVTTVKAVERSKVYAELSKVDNGTDNKGVGVLVIDGEYTGNVNRVYTVEVTDSTANDITVKVTSDDAQDDVDELTVPKDIPTSMGKSGLSLKISTEDTTNALLSTIGVTYKIECDADGLGDMDIIYVNTNLKPQSSVKVYSGSHYDSKTLESKYFNVTDTGIELITPLNKFIISGKIFTEYRCHSDAYANTVKQISISDGKYFDGSGEPKIGYTGIENPLGAMVSVALKGGTSVYCTSVKKDSVEEYRKAFSLLSRSTDTYAIVIGSLRKDVISALDTFVESQKHPSVANYKIGYYGLDDSPDVCVWDEYVDASGKTKRLTATLNGVVFTSTYPGIYTQGVREGDIIRIAKSTDASGNPTYHNLTVKSITSDTTCEVSYSGDTLTINDAKVFSVHRSVEGQELVDELKKRVYLNNHRCFCVFGDGIEIDGIKDAPAWLKACLPAGMRAGEYVHRPISNLAYSGCKANNKLNLSSSEMKSLASRGVWILANSIDGSTVYNYHQLSTDMSDKKYQEQSYTTNYDNISRGARALMAPYYGNSNISDALFRKLEADLYAFLHGKCTNAPTVAIGPQLISFSNLRLEQDPVNRDHVYLYVDYTMPAPFNHVTVKQRLI